MSILTSFRRVCAPLVFPTTDGGVSAGSVSSGSALSPQLHPAVGRLPTVRWGHGRGERPGAFAAGGRAARGSPAPQLAGEGPRRRADRSGRGGGPPLGGRGRGGLRPGAAVWVGVPPWGPEPRERGAGDGQKDWEPPALLGRPSPALGGE